MFSLREMCLPILILASGSTSLAAEEVWSLDGFQAPESALLDTERNVLYVSNVAGEPNAKDGVGFISKVSLDGKMQEAEWVKGLNAPKGLVMHGDKLYVSDVDQLVEIDVNSGAVTNTLQRGRGAVPERHGGRCRWPRVRLRHADRQHLRIGERHPFGLAPRRRAAASEWPSRRWRPSFRGSLGQDIQPDFSTKTPGHLLSIDLATKAISDVGGGEPVGNLDGLEPDGAGNWIVTDWVGGALFRIHPDGKADQLMDLNQGSADLEFVDTEKLVIIPMMMDGKVTAHRID